VEPSGYATNAGWKLVNCSRAVTIAGDSALRRVYEHHHHYHHRRIAHRTIISYYMQVGTNHDRHFANVSGIFGLQIHFHIPIPKTNSICISSWAWQAQLIKLASSMNYPHLSESGVVTRPMATWPVGWPSWDSYFSRRSACAIFMPHGTKPSSLSAAVMNGCQVWSTWLTGGSFTLGSISH